MSLFLNSITKMKLNKLTDIIPMIEAGESLASIGRKIKRSPATMKRYAKTLREAGYVLPTKKGRRKLKLDDNETS